MRIVLDTNVLVSGLLTPFGTCGEIVRMLTSGEVELCVDARILAEYEAVLRRPKFSIAPSQIVIVLDYIQAMSESFGAIPLQHPLPDEDDHPFLEIARSSRADCLVTGNLKHFPKRCCVDVRVVSPDQFVAYFRERSAAKSSARGKPE